MIQTINISLPKNLSDQIRSEVKKRGYVSVSEFIREAVRNYLHASTSFSEKAEKEIIKIAKSSSKKDIGFNSQKTSVPKMFEKIEKPAS